MDTLIMSTFLNDNLEPAEAADILWFLPTHGDGRYLGTQEGAREVSLRYLSQIARAADDLGYYGVLLPTGRSCEDSWVIASSLVPLTERLRFLVALRPGLYEPAAAARMAATLDRISGGRLLINVVAGGDPVELKGDGIFLSHDDRYAVTAEFLEVWKRLLAGELLDFKGKHLSVEGGKVFYPPVQQPKGKHLSVEGGKVFYPPVQQPYPPLFFGGSSDAGNAVAAHHADVYLTWGEPPADVARKISAVKALAASRGRKLRFGIRLHVIVRE